MGYPWVLLLERNASPVFFLFLTAFFCDPRFPPRACVPFGFRVRRPPGQNPTVRGGAKSGKACEHWDRLEEDLGLIKGLGVGSYR